MSAVPALQDFLLLTLPKHVPEIIMNVVAVELDSPVGWGYSVVGRRIVRQNSNFTGRSLGWRALLAAALLAQESGDLDKAESLAKKALDSARKYLGTDDIELVPVLTTLADLYKKMDRRQDEEWALGQMRLALKSIEPENT